MSVAVHQRSFSHTLSYPYFISKLPYSKFHTYIPYTPKFHTSCTHTQYTCILHTPSSILHAPVFCYPYILTYLILQVPYFMHPYSVIHTYLHTSYSKFHTSCTHTLSYSLKLSSKCLHLYALHISLHFIHSYAHILIHPYFHSPYPSPPPGDAYSHADVRGGPYLQHLQL